MLDKKIAIGAICLLLASAVCGCLENEEGKAITMTMEELMNDYNQSVDNDTKTITYWLTSLNDGDTLIIQDTLNNIIYNESYDYTMIEFESSVGRPFPNPIEGDITDSFGKGDTVELKMHIINVTFPYQGWTIKYETFEEGWDKESNTSIPIPQACISHA